MNSTDDRLDRIVEALNQVNVNIESLRVSVSSLVEHTEDQESRIRAMERWRHHLTPLLAALTFLLGLVATEILKQFV